MTAVHQFEPSRCNPVAFLLFLKPILLLKGKRYYDNKEKSELHFWISKPRTLKAVALVAE
jgi:hypothetical protein